MDNDYPSHHSRYGVLSNCHDRAIKFTESICPINIDFTITTSNGVFIGVQYRSFIWAVDEIYCVEEFTRTEKTIE